MSNTVQPRLRSQALPHLTTIRLESARVDHHGVGRTPARGSCTCTSVWQEASSFAAAEREANYHLEHPYRAATTRRVLTLAKVCLVLVALVVVFLVGPFT